MNKRERIMALAEGRDVDRTPVGFWLHFPEDKRHGQPSVEEHLKFFKETETDLFKIMNEYLYPNEHNIFASGDWRNVKACKRDSRFIREEIDMVKRIIDAVKGEAVVVNTIHGVVSSATHAHTGQFSYASKGRYAQLYHLRENPESVLSAYKAIAESLAILAEESIKAGADGIYYAAFGGERDGFTDEEHARYIAPLDKQVLEAAQKAPCNILHMCKPKVDLKRFIDYPCRIVNWGVKESGVTLPEAASIFPDKIRMGGINDDSPALKLGDFEGIKREVHGLIDSMGTKNFIIGSDCVLSSEMEYGKIALAARAAACYV
ncbi:MAG: uroporphyrinogen III decarboxylase [Hungatella sp.]|nr:uroporphyrinogen III decarboxylase [Hungatella sp.]